MTKMTKMTLKEAREECERWLAYCERTKARSAVMQEIVALRRQGKITSEEAERRMCHLQIPVVYSGEKLETAVRALLGSTKGA